MGPAYPKACRELVQEYKEGKLTKDEAIQAFTEITAGWPENPHYRPWEDALENFKQELK